MDITFSISSTGEFKRIQISFPDEPEGCEISAIMTAPSGREEIYLPSPDRLASSVTYPHSGGRFVTCTGKGRYQIIFRPVEKGEHTLKIFGRASGKRFDKDFQLIF